ncbi:AIPR family protein [Mesorhizobium sp. ESP7-2]|uniref:AIPR family protein n=1 Tax=Mesorhizobium sp. ESP7-2 TaxID=2876622 RepID=UPI001CCBB934|nr:AIPR family protein [Mesorhizobium sp. ESP7-2]MBZ9711471.1 AIPR family protein [Mesorhizobium sp. ESP7-2]
MSDDILIKTILAKHKSRYGVGLSDGDAFEFFCAETVLKPFALTFDEIEKGIVDGKNDGGIDSVYFFVNRSLIAIDTDMDMFKSPVTVDLYIIQSKIDGGFAEGAMAKLQAAVPQLIALDADPATLAAIYNSDVQETFETYRDGLQDLAGQFPTVNVHIIYATLANAGNDKVEAMIPALEKAVAEKFPKSTCKVELWGAAKLYEEAQKQNVLVKKLPFVKSAISHGKGYVFLAGLRDYYDFITDNGKIIDALFEFNVRDYQSTASVNKEIAATLKTADDQADFWWLNNGITILAEEAQSQDNKLTIKNPLVVNGLQTSHEIHRFFAGGGSDVNRSVQVRVLEIDDEVRRDRVIKATNSQTGIKPASLHATEPFQRKIEDFLMQLGIFYDRRKDYWRNKGKPADKIIGIERLAQSAMAVMRERPHDARARPTTILKEDAEYQALFADTTDLKIYQVCAELFFAVDAYFKKHGKTIDSVYRNNLRYHLMMQLAWELNGSRPVHIAALRQLKVSTLTEATIKKVLDHTIEQFEKAGAADKTAKSDTFTVTLQKASLVKASVLAAQAPAVASPAATPTPAVSQTLPAGSK